MNGYPGRIRTLFQQHILLRIEKLHRIQRPGAVIRIRMRSWLMPALCLFCLAWYVVSPNQVSASMAAALTGVFLASYLWAYSMAVRISAQRRLRYTAFQVGDEMEETITFQNRSMLPVLWVELVDHSDMPSHAVAGIRAANPHSLNEWRFHTLCSRRGVFRLGPWEMVMSDPFGIFQADYQFTQHEEILVFPPLASFSPAQMPHQTAFGSQRPLHQALAADTLQAYSTRRYLPGDPLRRIHWKTSARHDLLYVKEFDPEASSTIWLLPDLDENVQVGEGDDSTLEKMVLLLTTLANQLLHQRLAVGLAAHGAQKVVCPPRRSPAYFWQMLRAIAPLQASAGQPLAQTLDEIQPLIGSGDTLVILTPSLDPDWPRQLLASLSRPSVYVYLLDPRSYGGQDRAAPFQALLSGLGMPSSLIHREDIQPIPASYGAPQRWEFKTLSTGRVLVLSRPRAAGTAAKPGGRK